MPRKSPPKPVKARTPKRDPRRRVDTRALKMSPRDMLFVQHYLLLMNAEQAAIEAGFSPMTARKQANNWIGNNSRKPLVYAAVQREFAKIHRKLALKREDIIDQWSRLADADVRELVTYRRGACEHCWGKDHAYQWTHTSVFQRELRAAIIAQEPVPTDEGGYGYTPKRDPHPDCPVCFGDGKGRMVMKDADKLGPTGKLLYGGTKISKGSVEVVIESRSDARNSLAKHLGMLDPKITFKGDQANPITALFQQITGAALKPVENDPDYEAAP